MQQVHSKDYSKEVTENGENVIRRANFCNYLNFCVCNQQSYLKGQCRGEKRVTETFDPLCCDVFHWC